MERPILTRFALLALTALLAACATAKPDSLITPPDAALVPGDTAEPEVEAPAPTPGNAELGRTN